MFTSFNMCNMQHNSFSILIVQLLPVVFLAFFPLQNQNHWKGSPSLHPAPMHKVLIGRSLQALGVSTKVKYWKFND